MHGERGIHGFDREAAEVATAWGLTPSPLKREEVRESPRTISSTSTQSREFRYDLGSKDPPPDSMKDRRFSRKSIKPVERWTREDLINS